MRLILFFIFVSYAFPVHVTSASTSYNRTNACAQNIFLHNGKVKYKNRLAKLSCLLPRDRYIFLGDSVLTCVNGTWMGTHPVCVDTTNHCAKFDDVQDSVTTFYNRRTVVTVKCEPDFELIGSSTMYCKDNQKWNDTIPVCQALDINPSKCTFEEKCHWIKKRGSYFYWDTTGSNQLHNSPSFDSTLRGSGNGYYLLLRMRSSALKYRIRSRYEKFESEPARIVSPLYPPTKPNNTYCLIFHLYHNNFQSIFLPGTVNVNINNVTVWDLDSEPDLLTSEVDWHKVIVPLRSTSPFRITIAGNSELSGKLPIIAIDDVEIEMNENCKIDAREMETTGDEDYEEPSDVNSENVEITTNFRPLDAEISSAPADRISGEKMVKNIFAHTDRTLSTQNVEIEPSNNNYTKLTTSNTTSPIENAQEIVSNSNTIFTDVVPDVTLGTDQHEYGKFEETTTSGDLGMVEHPKSDHDKMVLRVLQFVQTKFKNNTSSDLHVKVAKAMPPPEKQSELSDSEGSEVTTSSTKKPTDSTLLPVVKNTESESNDADIAENRSAKSDPGSLIIYTEEPTAIVSKFETVKLSPKRISLKYDGVRRNGKVNEYDAYEYKSIDDHSSNKNIAQNSELDEHKVRSDTKLKNVQYYIWSISIISVIIIVISSIMYRKYWRNKCGKNIHQSGENKRTRRENIMVLQYMPSPSNNG